MYPLLDHSLDVSDGHHVDITVLNHVTASRCVDYLAAADIDRDVSAVASVVIAYDVADLQVASRYADTVTVTDGVSAVRQVYAGLCVAVHYETRAVNSAVGSSAVNVVYAEECLCEVCDILTGPAR